MSSHTRAFCRHRIEVGGGMGCPKPPVCEIRRRACPAQAFWPYWPRLRASPRGPAADHTLVTAKLFRPAAQLMSRLSYARKFALIGLVLLAPLAYSVHAYLG